MALLALSLNAQTTYEKVTASSQLVVGKKYILVSEDANYALTATASGSRLAGESVTISSNTVTLSSNSTVAVFTLGGSTNAYTLENGGNYLTGASNTNLSMATSVGTYSTWRLNNNNGALTGYRAVCSEATSRAVLYRTSVSQFGNYATSNIGSGNDYSYAFLYVEKDNTTPTAELTAPVNGSTVNVGTNTGSGVSKTINISGSNLTEALTVSVSGTGFTLSRDVTISAADANAGTSVTVTYNGTQQNATGALTITSTEIGTVTVNLTASYNAGGSSGGGEGTIGNGATQNNYLPAAGYYQDYGYKNQMIYTAAQLAEIGIHEGDLITSITFHPTTYNNYGTTYSGINFSGSQVTLSLGNTQVSSFNGSKITPDDLTDMVTISPVVDTSVTDWTFSWSTPFTYTGGNLLVQVYCPGYSASYGNVGPTGTYGYTYFKGDTQSSNISLYSTGSSATGTTGTNSTFQPQATFTFEANNTPALTAPENGSTINVGESLGGASVTKTITVSGRNLTEDLTVSVSGTGFTVSPTTLSATDVNNGTATVTITYSGTANGTGSMTISSNEVSVTVDLTATYVDTTPVLTAPENNSTVNVGTNTGSGVSKTINVKGQYLTQDLTVSVSGDGFTVTRDVTVTAAEANAGKDITVTYNGTNANATGTLTISSGEVSATVNLTASYSDNGEITVAEGTTTNMFLPVYGSYYEQVQLNQMIYPSSMLSDMEGKYITSITFYPAPGTLDNGTAISGIMFSGGKVMLSLGSTSNSSFTSNAAISASVSQVSEINNVQQDQNLTAWTFTFDTPYLYEGGNLLVQVDTEAGDYYRTFFYGTTMSNMGRHQYGSTGALDNFLPKATFTYTSNAPVVPAVEGGLLRLHLLFCDQLKASIPEDNSHPDAYGYILRFEPEGGETKESGEVRVNIQKTDCEVMGYYTLDQIDRDTNRALTMDVLTADVEYDLTSTNDMLNYYYLQGAESAYPRLDEDYLSKLYRQEDFTYREMYEESPEFNQVFNSGEHHYFDGSEPIKTGTYNDGTTFMSYAPSVTTWGVQRRYYELDMKDNTYGGPIWKTAVGKAEMSEEDGEQPVVEFQEGWNTSWTVDGKGANLYMLDNIHAIGYLPPESLTKVEFEPYMFRIFVESDNGLLRPYKYVTDDNGNKVITAGEGSVNGPTCVWSGYMNYDSNGNIIFNDANNLDENGASIEPASENGKFFYTKNKVERDATPEPTEDNPNPETPAWDKDANNAIFGALDELIITGYGEDGKPILRQIPEEDLRIFVRFYYCVKGEGGQHTPWTRGEGSRSGNGAESGGSAAGGVATSVNEVQFLGEIVSTTYYNVQGMQSEYPFEGINIVVTRFSNGATVVSKVVK